MTGLSGAKMVGMELRPSTLALSDSEGNKVKDTNCPFRQAIENGEREGESLTIRHVYHARFNWLVQLQWIALKTVGKAPKCQTKRR